MGTTRPPPRQPKRRQVRLACAASSVPRGHSPSPAQAGRRARGGEGGRRRSRTACSASGEDAPEAALKTPPGFRHSGDPSQATGPPIAPKGSRGQTSFGSGGPMHSAVAGVMWALCATVAVAAPIHADVGRWTAAHQSEILIQLDALVRLPSIAANPHGLEQTAEALEAQLRSRGFETRLLSPAEVGPK